MVVGSMYASMNEFRSRVRQHDVNGQLELRTRKSDMDRFKGCSTIEGCT